MIWMMQMGWLAGFAGLLALTVRAIRRARKDPRAAVARPTVLVYAVIVGALGASASWVWGGAFAHDGRDRIAAGGGAQAVAPARARLFVRAVQLAVGVTPAKVGYSPSADLRLPRRYNLEEAQRGWDLLQVSVDGPQGLRVTAVTRPEPTGTEVALSAHPRDADDLLPVTEDIIADSRSAVGRRWCRDHLARRRLAAIGFDKLAARGGRGGGAVHLDGAGVAVAVFCRNGLIVAALAFERDLGTAPGVAAKDAKGAAAPMIAVRVTPLRAGARGLEAEHTEIAAGTLLQIGALADAVPGITLWEIPAPAGRAELFFPPPDVLAPCSEWLSRRGPILPTMPESAAPRERVESGDIGASCVLPFSPPYAFEVRRLVPDVAGNDARSLWAGLLLVGPALVFLLVLGARVRSELTRPRVARGLALAWLSSLFAALGVWRLLWAHRLDMMREYESIGERVAGNQLLILFGAAALAGAAVMLAHDAGVRGKPRALLLAALAWTVTLVAGGHALGDQLAVVRDTRGVFAIVAQAALSLALGAGAGLGRVRAEAARVLRGPSERVLAAALAVAVLGFAGSAWAKTAVILKLPLACATVGLVYLVARDGLAGRTGPLSVRIAAAVAVVAAVVATIVYDIGVGVALLGPGVPIAFLLAGHDACLAPDARGKLGTFDRQHAPLVRAHAAVLAAVAVAVIVWASRAHADLGPAMTRGAMAAPVVFAVLVIVFGALWSRTTDAALEGGHRRFVIVTCGLLAVLAVGLTLLQGPLLEGFTDSESRHASRLSGVLDPGYALLRDDRDFLAGLAAWRETIVPEGAGTWPTGQGYFGAQVVDRGVWQSIENDYLPVLLVRETGALGLVAAAVLLVTAALGMWMIAGERFAHGSIAHRGRALAAAVLGALCVYQPLASLGVLPLTGISWPGLGLDSPTDFWLLFGVATWIVLGGREAAPGDAVPDPDASMRTGKGYVGVRRLALGVAALVAVAGVTLVARAARFALERPDPVDGAGDVAQGFEGLGHAADYAQRLQCKDEEVASADAAALVPAALLGEPVDDMSRRFHRQLRDRWNADRGHAVAELRRFLADPRGRTCGGGDGRWRFTRGDGEGTPTCTARWSFGWPELTLEVRAPDTGEKTAVATCDVALPGGALGALRRQDRRPFRGQRVRLVARPMGVAASDRGELVAGHVTVRLRPGAGEVDVSRAQAGVFAAEKVRLADDLTVEIARDGGTLEARGTVWTFEKLPPRRLVQVLEAEPTGWKLTAPATAGAAVPLPLESIAVLVIGGRESRNLWLYRPPRKWGGEAAGVDMLLADDVRTLGAARRRHYVLGGDLPELGWSSVDPSMSLGLDGWVQVALDRIEQTRRAGAAPVSLGPSGSPPGGRDGGAGLCGTLRPPIEPITEASPAGSDARDAPRMLDVGLNANVCARSTYDGVIECRLSLQPELTIALRHLTELIAADPARWLTLDGVAAEKSVPSTEGQFMLLRGDTGEIVAQGEFVPGRASSAFAPATPEIEQHLIRVLENRDPRTGAQLPTIEEDSSEKIEWNAPIAVGSTLKPLMARAFEMAAPDELARMVLRASPQQSCASGAHAILGHCPPTELWRRGEPTSGVDIYRFLSESSNWFMAAIGILGTSLPGGELKMGAETLTFDQVTSRDLGAAPEPVETSFDGASVITSRRVILAGLRRTALWRRFEAIVGRELCIDGAEACAKQIRGDVCAARALPITRPSSRLRHLVGLGPDRFELYGEEPRPADVPVREYLQFLRGSGKHTIGSLAQLTDAFGRVVYDPATDGTFRLAASWFPVPAAGVAPEPCTEGRSATVRGAAGGLCGVVRGRGTASRAMRPLLDDPRVVLYGAKSGTIDSLGDVAEDPAKCARSNKRRTIAGRPLTPEHQPYWLDCGKSVSDDSLFLVAFGVKTERGVERFTLGLRFERTGKSAATVAARHYIAAITAYISGAWSAPSPSAPSPSAPSPSPSAPSPSAP